MNNNNIFITPEDIALHIAALTNPKKVSDAMAFGGRPEQGVRTKYLKAANWVLEYAAQQVAAALAKTDPQSFEHNGELAIYKIYDLAVDYTENGIPLQEYTDKAQAVLDAEVKKRLATTLAEKKEPEETLLEALEMAADKVGYDPDVWLSITPTMAAKAATEWHNQQTASLREQLAAAKKQIVHHKNVRQLHAADGERMSSQLAEKDARIKELEEVIGDFSRIMRDAYWKANTDDMGFPEDPFYDDILRDRIEYHFKKHSIPLVIKSNPDEK